MSISTSFRTIKLLVTGPGTEKICRPTYYAKASWGKAKKNRSNNSRVFYLW